MLELVRYQRKPVLKAPESEEVIYSSCHIWSVEQKREKELEGLADMPIYSIPYNQIKKNANFKAQFFGL